LSGFLLVRATASERTFVTTLSDSSWP